MLHRRRFSMVLFHNYPIWTFRISQQKVIRYFNFTKSFLKLIHKIIDEKFVALVQSNTGFSWAPSSSFVLKKNWTQLIHKWLHWMGTYLIWFSSASYSIWNFFRLQRLTIKIPPERKLMATKFLSIHIGLSKVCLLIQLVSPRGKNFHSSILLFPVKSSRTLCYKQRFYTMKIKKSWWNSSKLNVP